MSDRYFRDRGPGKAALLWLAGSSQGAGMLDVARMLVALERAAAQALPPALGAHISALGLHAGLLQLAVPGPAFAARLRQQTPQLAQSLRDAGWPVERILIRVRAAASQFETKKPQRETTPLDKNALRLFADLEAGLEPSALTEAIGRLLRHHQ